MTGNPLDPTVKELKYNPKANELYAPTVFVFLFAYELMKE